jgi:hypothetical protein
MQDTKAPRVVDIIISVKNVSLDLGYVKPHMKQTFLKG